MKLLGIAAVFSLTANFQCASAQQTVHPTGDVFETPPVAASAAGKPACAPARRVVEIANSGHYEEFGALFAEDGRWLTPTGAVVIGPKEISRVYKGFLEKIRPRVVPISFIADGPECVMELVALTALDGYEKYHLGAIDHFTVDKDGKVTTMVVYLRPQSLQMQLKN